MLERVGFVGFGEAGYHIVKGLRGAGLSRTFAYDIDTGAAGYADRRTRRKLSWWNRMPCWPRFAT